MNAAPTRQDLIETASWERFRAAALIHDVEHTPETWLERQRAHGEWSAAFLGNESPAP